MRTQHLPLSPARRFMADLCHARQSVPVGVISRTISIAAIRSARAKTGDAIPWTVLFAKAFALVAVQRPDLRRAYVALPRPHLAEHDQSVASVMIEREWLGETGLFPAQLKRPERRSLPELRDDLARAVAAPAGEIRHFRVLMRLSRLPRPVRRLGWWLAFNIGSLRPTYCGTFGLSVLGQSGASIEVAVSPLTTCLSYGPFQPDGTVKVTLAFDHRVLDGGSIAVALAGLEETLNGTIADELAGLGVPV